MEKTIEDVYYPEGGTNIIFNMSDKTRIVMASNDIRESLYRLAGDGQDVEIEFDIEQGIFKVDDHIWKGTTRELEAGSFLFFGLNRQ